MTNYGHVLYSIIRYKMWLSVIILKELYKGIFAGIGLHQLI